MIALLLRSVGRFGTLRQVYHTSWIVEDVLTNPPKSVTNLCVIEVVGIRRIRIFNDKAFFFPTA